MKKKHRKYWVNEMEAITLFKVYGFKVKIKNFYTIRIYPEQFKGFIDWFHTQGTICTNYCGKFNGKLNSSGDIEYVAQQINNYVYLKLKNLREFTR